MLNYQPAFSPSVPPPTSGLQGRFLGQVPIQKQGSFVSLQLVQDPRSSSLGRAALNQTFEEVVGWPAWVGDVLRLSFHGGTTYLGIKVGLAERSGFLKYFSWVLGVGNGLAAIADIISIGKRLTGTHPVTPKCIPGTTEPSTTPPGSSAPRSF